ncbi:transferase [Streptomyces subrutilus]|uniref:Transferase n=1 Tax=Streptomyces subrutilus TaxID=36818 RepID=A0A1E5NZT9_9ACTN|nr:transferase [Streptomyces subrutilus]OEJ22261.1 transferase [Streptomyces subrutilus]
MLPLWLGDYVSAPTRGTVAATVYGSLGSYDLADFLACWPRLHRQALAALGKHRIHPSAFIHPQAIVGDDVIIGPDVKVWEFSTVRKGSVLCAGAQIGFNCEVTAAFVGEDTVLGHRIGLNRTIIGREAHLSAQVTIAAINMAPDIRTPDRDVIIRTETGIYRTGTPHFGAVLGDHTQTGNSISLGPGLAVGRHCRINSGVSLAIRTVPDHSTVTAPYATRAHIHPQRVRE